MMKKISIVLLSLICCLSLAACFTSGGDKPKTESNVILVDKEITVYVGETYTFAPTGAESFNYSSSNEKVAKVTSGGVVTGLADGTAFIDVSAGKKTVTCKVNVIKAENYIRLNTTGVTVAAGGDVTLTAEVITNGKVTDDEVTFAKSGADITLKQNVKNSVVVSVAKTGNYVVTATWGDLKAQCVIKAVALNAKTLATPEISVENCKTVKWNAVANASAYMYSVNGGEWVKTTNASFDVASITDGLKYNDEAIFAVKAMSGENDFNYIDGLPASIEFSHEYEITVIEEYTCAKAGKVSVKCSVCNKEYTDNAFLADHNMLDGACTVCGLQQTKKVVYRYDANNDCYFVVGADAGYDSADLYILAKYNDGEHGERPVKYIGYGAFAANKTIKRVYLPESMTEFVDKDGQFNKTKKDGKMVSSPLRGTVFDNCTNLEFVSMPGITVLRDVADAAYAHWNFRDCYNLKQVIVANGFDNYGATFMRWVNTPDNAENQTDIYVFGEKVTKLCNDSYPIGYDLGFGNNTLLTGDVFYYDENSADCYKWHYAEDGKTVVSGGKHVFNNKHKCKKCGAMNDFGINYGYYEGKDIDGVTDVKTYYVADNRTLNQTEVVILDEYTDGVHGTLPVTFVKNEAFAGNPSIKRVTLSKNITRLDGGVFLNCPNLEYVSMTGITNMHFINVSNKIFYGDGVNTGNNFLDCYNLKTLIVNEKFNLYEKSDAQQFLGRGSGVVPKIDIYSIGTIATSAINAAPNGQNNLLTGVVFYKGELDTCRRWTEEDGMIETSARDHDFVNGVCSLCGEKDAMGVIYQYNDAKQVYYVAGYTGTDANVKIFDTWNDGKNGEKAVKYVEFRAFSENKTITKIVLPESIDSLEGSVFFGCSNLEFVSMVGVKTMNWASIYNKENGDNNFRNCNKLKYVVIGTEFSTNCGQFNTEQLPAELTLSLYVDGASGNVNPVGNNALWTGNIFYKGNSSECGKWNYNADGEIVSTSHSFVNGKCSNCGIYNTAGVSYAYDGANEVYYVTGCAGNVTEVVVLSAYSDGTNPEKPVTYVKNSAFADNANITKVILPESVKQLDGGVFRNCENLEYVSMLGVTDMAFLNLSGKGIYANASEVITNNNFLGCTKLKRLIVNKNFNLFRDSADAQQFVGDAKCIDLYVMGSETESNVRVTGGNGNNGLLSGKTYYYSETAKAGCWHYDDNGNAVPWEIA